MNDAVLLLAMLLALGPQDRPRTAREQTYFSVEDEENMTPIRAPQDVPESLMALLAKDDRAETSVRVCRGLENLPDDHRIPADWFVVSVIHLESDTTKDYVILPKKSCLKGANVGPFWIAKGGAQGYTLVLSVSGHDLSVLNSRHEGIRDVEAISTFAGKVVTTVYHFDGTSYRFFSTKTEPITGS